MKAYITIGLPACGKSTWANGIDAHRLERDLIRQGLCAEKGAEFAWATWDLSLKAEVQRRWDARLRDLIHRRVNIVVSDTNLNSKYRRDLAHRLVACGYDVTYVFFDVPEDVCRQRNAARGPFAVQDEAYERLRSRFVNAKSVLKEEARQLKVKILIRS